MAQRRIGSRQKTPTLLSRKIPAIGAMSNQLLRSVAVSSLCRLQNYLFKIPDRAMVHDMPTANIHMTAGAIAETSARLIRASVRP